MFNIEMITAGLNQLLDLFNHGTSIVTLLLDSLRGL